MDWRRIRWGISIFSVATERSIPRSTSSGQPINADYGNAFIKLSTAGSALSVADYFTMHNTVGESAEDGDSRSGGALVLPDLTDSTGKIWHLAVGAGKDANVYVVNRDAMGKFNPNNDSAIYEELTTVLSHGGVCFTGITSIARSIMGRREEIWWPCRL